jgi:adenosylcobinamide-GDP ribazoletransferase
MLHPLFVALRFLTRLPFPLTHEISDQHIGRSLLYYPVVGLIIGILLATLHWLLIDSPATLAAALLLMAWVFITGGLHLDGLSDSADAWVGGLGDRERTLAIMKDPCCGSMGVVALVVILIVKFAALQTLINTGDVYALVLAPVIARSAIPALFLLTPYVRIQGLGTPIVEHLPRRDAMIVTGLVVIAIPLFAGQSGFWMLLYCITVFAILRTIMIKRIGGTTGDTAGALVELLEATALVVACLD